MVDFFSSVTLTVGSADTRHKSVAYIDTCTSLVVNVAFITINIITSIVVLVAIDDATFIIFCVYIHCCTIIY